MVKIAAENDDFNGIFLICISLWNKKIFRQKKYLVILVIA